MKAKAFPLLVAYTFTACLAVGCSNSVASSVNPEQGTSTSKTSVESGEYPSSTVAATSTEVASTPKFSLAGSDGNTHSLESLTKDGTTVVFYFIQSTCPINNEALPFVNQIGNGYLAAKKVKFVGIIDEDKSGFADWNKKWKTKYLVLFNPDVSAIKAFGAQRSPWFNIVSPDKTVAKVDAGYSSKQLSTLNDAMAKAAGTKAISLKLQGAPSSLSYG